MSVLLEKGKRGGGEVQLANTVGLQERASAAMIAGVTSCLTVVTPSSPAGSPARSATTSSPSQPSAVSRPRLMLPGGTSLSEAVLPSLQIPSLERSRRDWLEATGM